MNRQPLKGADGPSPLDRVRALRGLIEHHAARDEGATQLADEVAEALRASGLFALATPAAIGGEECHPLAMIDATSELAYYDGSTGWYAAVLMTGGAIAGAYLGERAIDAMFRSGPMKLCSGSAAPVGRAERVGDSYRISGHFTFGSGTPSTAYCVGGYLLHDGDGLVLGANGAPIHLIALAPRAQVRFHGNWNVLGLRGTGSYDYEVCETVVHEDFVIRAGATPARRGGALYRIGFMAIPCLHHGSWALGVARRALDEWREQARTKKRGATFAGGKAISSFANEIATMQRDFAVAHGELRAAEAYYRQSYARLFEAVEASAPADEIEALQLDARLSTSHMLRTGTHVTQTAFTACTTFAVRDGSVIQRCFRDSQTGNAHILTGEQSYIEIGRALAGIEGAKVAF